MCISIHMKLEIQQVASHFHRSPLKMFLQRNLLIVDWKYFRDAHFWEDYRKKKIIFVEFPNEHSGLHYSLIEDSYNHRNTS